MILLGIIIPHACESVGFFRQTHDLSDEPRYLHLNVKYNVLNCVSSFFVSADQLAFYKLHILDCVVKQHPLWCFTSIQPFLVYFISVVHFANLVDRDRQNRPPPHETFLSIFRLQHITCYLFPIFVLSFSLPFPALRGGCCIPQFFCTLNE